MRKKKVCFDRSFIGNGCINLKVYLREKTRSFLYGCIYIYICDTISGLGFFYVYVCIPFYFFFYPSKEKKKKKKRRQSNILNYLLHIYRRKKIFCIYIKINFILAVEWQSNTCLIYILIRRQKKKEQETFKYNDIYDIIKYTRIYKNLFIMNNITLKEKNFFIIKILIFYQVKMYVYFFLLSHSMFFLQEASMHN